MLSGAPKMAKPVRIFCVYFQESRRKLQPRRSRSMSLRGPSVQASRQEQGLSRPEWTRNVQEEECDGKIRKGCWQKREERHAPRKGRDTSLGQRSGLRSGS